jgi:O-antigen/teichoic acid export membrane protein
VLAIHIYAGIFVALGVANSPCILAENLQWLATLNTLIGAATNVVLNYFLIPVYGIPGVAFSTFISYGIAAYISLAFHEKTRDQFYRITSSVFLGLRLMRESENQ